MTTVLPSFGKKRNKYGAKKCEYDGHKFDSMAERDHYIVLKMREKAGEISNLRVHPKFELTYNGRPIKSRSDHYPEGRRLSCEWDFGYTQEGVGIVYEDVKSPASITEAYRLRRAIFEAIYYPATVVEIMAGRKRGKQVRAG